MKTYSELNRQDRKVTKMVADYNVKVAPAKSGAKQIANEFELDGATERRIKSILEYSPNLRREISKNIETIMETMLSYDYDLADAKDFIRKHSDVLAQSNLGLTTKLQALKDCGLEERALTRTQNLLYKSTKINPRALAVIDECLEAYNFNEDEVCDYFASHTEMLGQNSIELRRTFAILHRHNLLENALFEDSRVLGVNADSGFMFAMLKALGDKSDVLVNNETLYLAYKETSAVEKEALKKAYPFSVKEKMVVDYFYNDFVKQGDKPQVRERR